MRTNTVKEKLRNGEVSIGTMVFEFNTPGMASLLEQTGVDFAIYDMEHSGFGFDSVRQLMSYNRGLNLMPFVRVPDTQYTFMARTLDIGAMGLMIPMVESKEQVQTIVGASKYYPIGKRGTAFGVAHDGFRSGDPAEKMSRANDETLIIALVETEAGIENIEEIVSTEEIDVAWVGHFDLSQSMGIPGQVEHPRLIAAMERVAEVCQKHGKAAGRMVNDADQAMQWIEKGYRCLAYSGDIWILQNALSQGVAQIKERLSTVKK